MTSRMVDFFWKHPWRFILRLFLAVTALCLLLTFMPKWFNTVVGIFLFGMFIIIIMGKWDNKVVEKHLNQENKKNYEEMYEEYSNLLNREIEKLGVDEKHIHQEWFDAFYTYVQKATRLCNRGKFTDFHIAACVIFSLVSYTDSVEHTEIIYKCIRNLIANPKVYIRHINDDNDIILEVQNTLKKKDIRVVEDEINTKEIAKIIKAMYVRNKTGKALMELADFMNRIYLSCN